MREAIAGGRGGRGGRPDVNAPQSSPRGRGICAGDKKKEDEIKEGKKTEAVELFRILQNVENPIRIYKTYNH